MHEMTRILSAIEKGDPAAAGKLLPLVYEELHKLAAQRMATESAGHTLQATALVHEAYLRLVDVDNAQQWNGRGHCFAAAAEAMRRILIDNAQRKRRSKQGGDLKRINLDDAAELGAAADGDDDLLELDAALDRLLVEDEQAAQLVKLRYFAGLTIPQAARR
jgi:RNA polymerase sigma factor (TIGR02999 family)